VGGGAREHAMAAALARSPDCSIHALMKHRNPGIAALAADVRLASETDAEAVVEYARKYAVDLAVIGPEAPLEAGVSDALRAAGIAVASPSKDAARIETDKRFMRELMARHDIPGRLAHHPFDNLAESIAFLDGHGPQWAIKPICLTGGKGVQVYGDHFTDLAGAKRYVKEVFETGAGGGTLQFEELAEGEEVTIMGFTDGRTVLPMPAVQDHKRLREGDKGPNTGGMGSYSQCDGLLPFLTKGEYEEAVEILEAIVAALRQDGTPYVGAIYGQFMLTARGPKIIEINARLGDPEAMNVLHLLETDYVMLLHAMVDGELAVVKYVVLRGYGEGRPEAGAEVHVDTKAIAELKATVYYANITEQDGALRTLTSRTLAVLGEAETLADAERIAEAALDHIRSNALVSRHDIGTPALIEKRIEHMKRIRAKAAD
jgi:phosphoribosylamine---glycine ligase